ncbi:phospholipase D family protein [Komagataeibacter europaeus]|uniref:phospholipase D family protein n=1 Tax=Komagataeibacter europaeus TaxID=33995 RepID=UPI000237DEFF|nr:phospholipase D family protein [Komagataeibacter europaeus]
MPIIVDGTELSRRLKKALNKATNACFAVAFWGRGAAEEIGMGDGMDIRIVCNLLTGGTNPDEIRKLIRRGAKVRQLNNLHAKIGVTDHFSFLGSSNMSTNGLGNDGAEAGWMEANVIYENRCPIITEMFEDFWEKSSKIEDDHLIAATKVWELRRRGEVAIASVNTTRSLVDVLRNSPEQLDALNVRMVVYNTVTDEDDLIILEKGDEEAQSRYGKAFEIYCDWDSIADEAANAYLVDYDWPARGQIARGGLYRRDTRNFPDFLHDGKTFHPVYKIDNIEGITFDKVDKAFIRAAFHMYVQEGRDGEGGRHYNFPISELAPYLPSRD